jgi:hypothetical protein
MAKSPANSPFLFSTFENIRMEMLLNVLNSIEAAFCIFLNHVFRLLFFPSDAIAENQWKTSTSASLLSATTPAVSFWVIREIIKKRS